MRKATVQVLAVLLTLVLTIMLAACGQPKDPEPQPKATDPVQSDESVQTTGDQQTGASQSSSSPAASQSGQTGGEKHARLSSISAPSGIFNPLLVNDDYNMYICSLVYESLVMVAKDATAEPFLAESWDISEDSRSITFHLAKNAKWHDGVPLTAEDVKFTYEYLAHKDYPGPKASYAKTIEGFDEMKEGKADELKGIEIIDEHTVKITTTEPFAPFLQQIGFRVHIIPKHIWSQVEVAASKEATDLLRNPVGSGPFKFFQFVPDQYTTVAKNEDYWQGPPKLDKVSYVVVNPDTSEAQLLNGELDELFVTQIDPEVIEMFEKAGFNFQTWMYNAYQDMIPNNDNPMINNKYLRQALMYGINRQGIVDTLLFGKGNVANQVYPTFFWPYPGDDKLNMYEYNPEKAIELLTKEVGWEYKDGKMYADGQPVKFVLTYPPGNKVRELSAPVIQENLGDIGIEIELQMVEFASLVEMVETPGPDAFDFVLMGHGIGEDADVSSLFYSTSGSNFMRWRNEKGDELLDKGRVILDVEQRKPIYTEFAQLVNEEAATIFLYNWSAGCYTSPRFKGYVGHPFTIAYNCLEWDIVE